MKKQEKLFSLILVIVLTLFTFAGCSNSNTTQIVDNTNSATTTAFNPNGTNGLFADNAGFFGKQLGAVALSSVWAFGFTYAMLAIINRITPVHVSGQMEEIGLDQSLHGEKAYLDTADD